MKEAGDNGVEEEEDDPHYMTFLANAKPHGKSYVLQATDQNGLPLLLHHDKDDNQLGRSTKALTTENRIVENQKMKDAIFFSKKRRNEDKDIGNRKNTVAMKMKDGISLTEKRRNEDRVLGNRKHTVGNNCHFVYESLDEAISESVEILENVGRASGFNPFVPSVEHSHNLDATIIDSGFRKEVLNLLTRPYNEEEYKKLWKDVKMQLPSSSTNERGKSLLLLHKSVNREIKRTNHDKDKKLNIMRGFFFWLEHLTRQDAFQPWEDAECLQMMPGSS